MGVTHECDLCPDPAGMTRALASGVERATIEHAESAFRPEKGGEVMRQLSCPDLYQRRRRVQNFPRISKNFPC